MDEDLNVRAKTVKLLEENTGINLNDLRVSSRFLDMTSKAQTTTKIKSNTIKVKISVLQRTLLRN